MARKGCAGCDWHLTRPSHAWPQKAPACWRQPEVLNGTGCAKRTEAARMVDLRGKGRA